jgi:hypothetical protein
MRAFGGRSDAGTALLAAVTEVKEMWIHTSSPSYAFMA